MSNWPATRVTLLDRVRDYGDQRAWAEFVALYGPLVFQFARRRLSQDADAADVLQEVLRAVMGGSYRRQHGRFQKWLVTVVLNKVRNFLAMQSRRGEIVGGQAVADRLLEEPSRAEVDEWDRERDRRLYLVAAERVRVRVAPVHWDVFVQVALENRPGQEVAAALGLSPTNVYAIKCRLLQQIKEEVQRLTG